MSKQLAWIKTRKPVWAERNRKLKVAIAKLRRMSSKWRIPDRAHRARMAAIIRAGRGANAVINDLRRRVERLERKAGLD